MHTQSIIYKWNRVCKLIVQRQMSVSRYATCIGLNEWSAVMISAMAPTFRKGFLHPSSGLLKKNSLLVSQAARFLVLTAVLVTHSSLLGMPMHRFIAVYYCHILCSLCGQESPRFSSSLVICGHYGI